MTTLPGRIRRIAGLSESQAEHLRRLVSSWQILADLSFSDLLLYVKVSAEEVFEICAQVRPFTSQTLYPQDMVGIRVGQPEQPIVERAYREGLIWGQDDPVLVDGVPIRMDAIPVCHRSRVIAVLTREGSPSTSRRPGLLERVYLEAADGVSRMVAEGLFPWRDVPQGEWPRVGDGLFLLDRSGQITWASPNALSALSRLDIRQNAVGSWLDDISPGLTPVAEALAGRRLVDGELVNGGTHVFLRVMPLIEDGHVTGGLVLARDVTELRQKDRVISVKDATIREIHHRVKNNLQTIASLLRLQARRLDSEEGRAALTESVLRVSTIALVHETLSEELTDTVEFGDVAGRIARMAAEGFVLPDRQLEIKVTGSTGGLTADVATPLAVAVTELLQNSIEHGFPYAGTGTVVVELAREKGHAVVVVRDDGVGMPEQAPVGARLGLNIVRTLVAELGGSFEVVVDGGTRTELRVPTSPAR